MGNYHAGYYPKNGPNKTNLEAQIDMIDESLKWAGIDQASEVSVSTLSLTAHHHMACLWAVSQTQQALFRQPSVDILPQCDNECRW